MSGAKMETTRTGTEPIRILIVDDHKDAANSMALLLKTWGFDTRAEYNGKKAIEALQTFKPHCVLSDIGMPEIDGYTLAKLIRQDESFNAIPLIAISAFNEREQAKAAGFDHYFVKPADPGILEKLLKELFTIGKQLYQVQEVIQQHDETIKEVKHEVEELKHELDEIKKELRDGKDG